VNLGSCDKDLFGCTSPWSSLGYGHFIAPGLYDMRTDMSFPFVSISTFDVSCSEPPVAYYVVIPLGFRIVLWMFAGNLVNFLQTLDEYIGIFTKILFGFGVAFELPVILFFLGMLGLINDINLRDFFGYAVLIIFVFAAILTPPDVITQLLMAGPLILLVYHLHCDCAND